MSAAPVRERPWWAPPSAQRATRRAVPPHCIGRAPLLYCVEMTIREAVAAEERAGAHERDARAMEQAPVPFAANESYVADRRARVCLERKCARDGYRAAASAWGHVEHLCTTVARVEHGHPVTLSQFLVALLSLHQVGTGVPEMLFVAEPVLVAMKMPEIYCSDGAVRSAAATARALLEKTMAENYQHSGGGGGGGAISATADTAALAHLEICESEHAGASSAAAAPAAAVVTISRIGVVGGGASSAAAADAANTASATGTATNRTLETTRAHYSVFLQAVRSLFSAEDMFIYGYHWLPRRSPKSYIGARRSQPGYIIVEEAHHMPPPLATFALKPAPYQ